ncbi:carboxymuconolactone decarboxylase family protein [Deinococcus hopiensis]|uniref:Alkylhydroperoxidase family enzyme, contains CxxC motif n=1 Tax=Deinococcus hopiensis KR-140 TaxID=695939 RepID=A0A1W1UQN6_9DEIO|nr:carboxymuconolactone decarboxylase family protein [Deinococcus hopiensis]SMB83121.1 Alkylhydroperoxidase family enzyme, contains CxxC motif [Deinococcus hopiensis KR-140]
MATARIEPLEAPFNPAITATFSRYLPLNMAPLKLFRTQAHNPRVLQRMFAGNLLDPGSISLRLRELVILRTCARCGSEYEWGVHVALFAARAALEVTDIAATLQRDLSAVTLPANEWIVLKAADELHDTSTLCDGTWRALAEHHSNPQILEIIALVGHYHAVSFATNALAIEPEPFAARFSGSVSLPSVQ